MFFDRQSPCRQHYPFSCPKNAPPARKIMPILPAFPFSREENGKRLRAYFQGDSLKFPPAILIHFIMTRPSPCLPAHLVHFKIRTFEISASERRNLSLLLPAGSHPCECC
jgi:hypothetical protein